MTTMKEGDLLIVTLSTEFCYPPTRQHRLRVVQVQPDHCFATFKEYAPVRYEFENILATAHPNIWRHR